MRTLSALLWAAVLAYAGVTVLVFTEDEWRALVDSAIAVLTAQSLRAGEGYLHLGRPFFLRPPGLAALLVPFVGDAVPDFRTLNLLVQVCAAGAFVAVGLALQRLQGRLLGPLLALLFAVNALTVAAFNEVLDGFPFVLLFFAGAFCLLHERGGKPPSWSRAMLGAVLLAAAAWTSTPGLLALPALVLSGLPRRGKSGGRRIVAAALMGVLVLPWLLWSADAHALAERPATQLPAFDDRTALLRVDPRDPDSAFVPLPDWGARLGANAQQLGRTFGHALTGSELRDGDGVLAWLLFAGVTGALLFAAHERRSWLDLYALLSLGLLLVQVEPSERLVLPLLPLLLSALAHTLLRVAQRAGHRLPGPGLGPVTVAAASVALLAASLVHLPDARARPELQRVRERSDQAVAQWLVEHTPPHARILHERGAVLTLLSGRRTSTWRHLPGPWPQGAPLADYAVFSPAAGGGVGAVEQAVAAAARERLDVRVPGCDRPEDVRVYRLTDDVPPLRGAEAAR